MSKNMGETLMSFFILKILWFRLLVFLKKNYCQFFLSVFRPGTKLSTSFFILKIFVVSPSSFYKEKLLSNFSICVYVWGETLMSFFIL